MTWVVERAILKGRLGGIVQTRTMFTGEVSLVSPDTVESIWSTYIGTILNPISAYIGSFWATETLELQYLDVSNKWVTSDEVPFPFTFSGSGDPLAYFVSSVLIGKALGRRKMGRKFIPGLTESYVNGNSLSGALVAAMASACVAYISPLTTTAGSQLYPGILDKTNTFQRFIGGFVSSLLGTTRRRKPGLGI